MCTSFYADKRRAGVSSAPTRHSLRPIRFSPSSIIIIGWTKRHKYESADIFRDVPNNNTCSQYVYGGNDDESDFVQVGCNILEICRRRSIKGIGIKGLLFGFVVFQSNNKRTFECFCQTLKTYTYLWYIEFFYFFFFHSKWHPPLVKSVVREPGYYYCIVIKYFSSVHVERKKKKSIGNITEI